ncbi:hypothetical protein BGZ96_002042 [Linnemannia gamsii]|uniref:Uncharacterized protein n=1 Tax=Linnemannia gamsii TaxID=64522 RepID=A0ABQ7K8H1_9FUNG|nr:hypothetical protein BGZ96_002042 [Linnemannia gamsii]
MTTDTAPAAQPSDQAPVKSIPIAKPITTIPDAEATEVSSPVHHDAEKLYQQYLHPDAIQVVKDNGKPIIDLGSLPNHDAVADTLQDTGADPLGPTLVPYHGDEDTPIYDAIVMERPVGVKVVVKPAPVVSKPAPVVSKPVTVVSKPNDPKKPVVAVPKSSPVQAGKKSGDSPDSDDSGEFLSDPTDENDSSEFLSDAAGENDSVI